VDCPNLKVITLAEWEVVKEIEIEEEENEDLVDDQEENQEEVEKEADEGEMVVLRRVLGGQEGAKNEQKENIFHSRCMVQGKACSFIIDGGSCYNMVFLSMIEKLGLQATTHPHPYNIQRLNQGKGLQVNSRCLISFSIGKNYQDEL